MARGRNVGGRFSAELEIISKTILSGVVGVETREVNKLLCNRSTVNANDDDDDDTPKLRLS